MEENNELKDIVLEKDDADKVGKVKRILISIAILVLLFLIVLIIMRGLNKTEVKENDSRLVLPPEPKEIQEKPDDDKLFRQVPIIPEDSKKDSFDEMMKNLKEQELKKENEKNITKLEDTKELEVKKEQEEKKEVDKIEKEVKKKQPKPKKTENKPIKIVENNVKPITSKVEEATKSGIYIQVTATNNYNPNIKYFKNLRKKGYDYKIYKTIVNNKEYTKILLGPYSKKEINTKMKQVRQNLTKDAFVFRIK